MSKQIAERMIPTSIQLTVTQFQIVDELRAEYQNKISIAEILRTAFNYYIENEFPNLKKKYS